MLNRFSVRLRILGIGVAFILVLGYAVVNRPVGFPITKESTGETKINLIPGDVLARPNANWLPGSSRVSSGMKFGHAAVVVQGASGNTWEEVLAKALVVESLIYDQGKQGFTFNPQKQVRLAPAIISFGSRFAGRRYRLRTISEPQRDSLMRAFLLTLPGKAHYSLGTTKSRLEKAHRNDQPVSHLNCATLVWCAYRFTTGEDTDANQGCWVFPNDIICSPVFEKSGERMRF